MNQFYVTITVVGIILMLISVIWIIIDKKNFVDYCEKIDNKKSDLKLLLDDAELMIDEMNRFSDYVVKQFDNKEKEIRESLCKLDGVVIKKDNIQKNMYKTPKQIVKSYKNTNKINKIEKNIVNLKPEYGEIMKLEMEGFSPREIAKKLSMGIGEVSLIIGMNKAL